LYAAPIYPIGVVLRLKVEPAVYQRFHAAMIYTNHAEMDAFLKVNECETFKFCSVHEKMHSWPVATDEPSDGSVEHSDGSVQFLTWWLHDPEMYS